MSKVVVFLADGHEECEALIPADLLRRAGIEVVLASITGKKEVTGSHGIHVTADALAEEVDYDSADLLFLPGGLPGTTHLGESALVREKLTEFAEKGKKVSAICAAPSILGELGLVKGHRATCYPGFETKMEGADCRGDGIITDRLISTGRGMGWAIDLGLELIKLLVSEEEAERIKAAIQYIK